MIASPFRVTDGDAPTFVVELSHFTGPLDLLLALIRDEQLDIYDIPIARVAEQFLARIGSLGLDEAADYLEMAARLLRIKAQMLLPRADGGESWEDPRARNSSVGCSSISRCAKSWICWSIAGNSDGTSSAVDGCRRRPIHWARARAFRRARGDSG